MTDLIAEHDVVVLTRDLPDEGLEAGDVGVVLLTHSGHDDVPPGYTVEVTTLLGETVAVVDVPADLVRPVVEHDVRHARSFLGVAQAPPLPRAGEGVGGWGASRDGEVRAGARSPG